MAARHGNESSFLMHNGQFFGIACGADFTSEHEWGIEPLRKAFGTAKSSTTRGLIRTAIDKVLGKSENQFGLAARSATTVPTKVSFQEDKTDGGSFFLMVDAAGYGNYTLDQMRYATPFKGMADPATLSCAWCENSFIVRVRAEHKEWLQQLHQAILNKDFAIGNAAPNYEKARGLCLYIVSAFPKDVDEEWAKEEQEAFETQQRLAAWWDKNASDVMPALEAAGKRWHYLGCDPGPDHYPKTRKFIEQEGVVRVCLNPSYDSDAAWGYYTAEELRLWAQGKGPVVEKKMAKLEKGRKTR